MNLGTAKESLVPPDRFGNDLKAKMKLELPADQTKSLNKHQKPHTNIPKSKDANTFNFGQIKPPRYDLLKNRPDEPVKSIKVSTQAGPIKSSHSSNLLDSSMNLMSRAPTRNRMAVRNVALGNRMRIGAYQSTQRSFRIESMRLYATGMDDSMEDYQDRVFRGIPGEAKFGQAPGRTARKTSLKAVTSQVEELIPEEQQEEIDPKKEQESPEEGRVFGGPVKSMKWPPSDPLFGDVDRREGIVAARLHPDFHKTFQEYIDEQGLELESHLLINSCHYEQNIFRINDPNVKASKGAVFLQHGLFASADSWVVHKDKSLAIKLAKEGYDVWMGNLRGNKYNRENQLLDPYWNKYWQFSLNELALDLIETIDFVCKKVHSGKIAFVGHGHASTLLFMCMHDNSQFVEERLTSCVALAPVVHSDFTQNSFYDFYSKHWRSFKGHVEHELWGRGYTDRMKEHCAPETTHRLEQAFWDSYKANESFDDEDMIKAYMGHFPHGGVGDQVMDHLGQMFHSCKIQAYDTNILRTTPGNTDREKKNGDLDNFMQYRSRLPREFFFSKLAESKIPINVFSAGHDLWADARDTSYLYKQLSQTWTISSLTTLSRTYANSEYERQHHELPNASHLSFFIGKDMGYVDKVAGILDRHCGAWLEEYATIEQQKDVANINKN